MPDAPVTFRDFMTALSSGTPEEAARVLETLMALDPAAAATATAHFAQRMKTDGQAFLMKAMGLRQAVTAPDEASTRDLVADCFGLDGPARDAAATALRARYA